MIENKQDLEIYLEEDSKNYKSQVQGFFKRIKTNLLSNPISEQKYIWRYIKTLRYVEYYDFKRKNNIIYYPYYIVLLSKLRKLSHITGFQIPPHVCGKGLTIWHWGSIIVNPSVRIGDNCTLYPGVLIGHKTLGDTPIIGNNVFIGSGTKIIGQVNIGDNVTIGQNCTIVKSIPANTTVVSSAVRSL